jgi:DNA (cytosine-5)-methyltransferase 1
LLGYLRNGDSEAFTLSPLIEGTPNRVGRLRGYGNAIIAPLAAQFIRAYLDTEAGCRVSGAGRRT